MSSNRRGQTGGTKPFGVGEDPFKRQQDRRRHADAESGVAGSLPERRGPSDEAWCRHQTPTVVPGGERRREATCQEKCSHVRVETRTKTSSGRREPLTKRKMSDLHREGKGQKRFECVVHT
eukprot:scaffold324_cov326-Pavlova_lutheri.AAC.49